MPARNIDGVEYLDGGYFNNMPTGLAARLGAEELVCVDLEGLGFTRPNRTGLPTTMIRSHWELGEILRFDPAVARRNMELGYYDTMRAFGRVRGGRLSGRPCPAAARPRREFRARFDPLQEAVKARWPAAHLPAALAPGSGRVERRASGPPWKPPPRPPGWTPPACIRWKSWSRLSWPAATPGRLAGFDPLFEGGRKKIQAAPRWPPGPRCCPICSCRPLSAGR